MLERIEKIRNKKSQQSSDFPKWSNVRSEPENVTSGYNSKPSASD